MVEYPEGLLECTTDMSIPQTVEDAWEMWSNDETLEILPPLRALDNRKTVRAPKAMYVRTVLQGFIHNPFQARSPIQTH
jgi:hypothetical protein